MPIRTPDLQWASEFATALLQRGFDIGAQEAFDIAVSAWPSLCCLRPDDAVAEIVDASMRRQLRSDIARGE